MSARNIDKERLEVLATVRIVILLEVLATVRKVMLIYFNRAFYLGRTGDSL